MFATTTLAGCFESGRGNDGLSQPTGPRPGGDNSTLNATLRQIRWENCTGMVGIYEVPYENARRVVPSAFVPYSPFVPGGLTAGLLFDVVHCDRVTAANRTFEQAGFFQSMARVRPADSSWVNPGRPSRFSLDFLVAPPELGRVLNEIGLPNEPATLERTDLSAEWTGLRPVVRLWKYVSANSTVELEYYNVRFQLGGTSGSPYGWFQNGETFVRVDQELDIDYDYPIPAGALRLMGSTQSSRLLGAPVVPWTGQGYLAYNESWDVNETAYRI